MQSRTSKQIEKDYKKVKQAAQTATTIKEVEDLTGLSRSQINTTLYKHPIDAKQLRDKIKSNNRVKKERENNQVQQVKDNKEDAISGFVVDASFAEICNFKKTMQEIELSGEKIILTSSTVDKLTKLQRCNNALAEDACYILDSAIEQPEKFELVANDDDIVEFCKDKNIVLLTSDKEMVLKARINNINVQYYRKFRQAFIRTLLVAHKIGEDLVITEFQKEDMSVCVYSNGIEYSKGRYILKIGDDVFVSKKREDYITFAHYKIISLQEVNNSDLMYSRRIYDYSNIDLDKKEYTYFVKDFIARM